MSTHVASERPFRASSPHHIVTWKLLKNIGVPYSIKSTHFSMPGPPPIHKLVDHHFRHEAGKLVSVLAEPLQIRSYEILDEE